MFSGNACFNLVGDLHVIKHWMENEIVFPIPDDARAKIIVYAGSRNVGNDEGAQLLYPEIRTHHAVVNRIKDKVAG